MKAPDEWTEQDDAALGDMAYSKLEAELNAARTQLDAIRRALGAYPDSDLASLAITVQTRSEALDVAEAQLASLKAQTCAVCGRQHPAMNVVTLCDNCYEDRIA